jgi:hypothetical protein
MLKIVTNNHDRQFAYRYDVPESVLAGDLDWTTEEDSDGYFCYRGYWYHLGMFMRVGYPGPFGQTDDNGYHGYHNDSFSSGVLIKCSDDGETYRVATFYSLSGEG